MNGLPSRGRHGVLAAVHKDRLAVTCGYLARHVRLECACGWSLEVGSPDTVAGSIRDHAPGAVWLDWAGREVGVPKRRFA